MQICRTVTGYQALWTRIDVDADLSNKLPAVAGKIRQRMFYMDSQDVLYIVRCYGVVKRSFTAPGHQLAYGSLKVADGELDKVACKIHRTGENSPVSHDKP